MDSGFLPVSERILRRLAKNKIMAILFPAHTTNIFQTLDLAFVGALKKRKGTATGQFDDDEAINDQITQLVHAYEQTTTSMTIRGSFRRTGMYPDCRATPFKLTFAEKKLRSSSGFEKISDRNIMIQEVACQGRLSRFGLANAECLVE
jgi:hypothetical protein